MRQHIEFGDVAGIDQRVKGTELPYMPEDNNWVIFGDGVVTSETGSKATGALTCVEAPTPEEAKQARQDVINMKNDDATTPVPPFQTHDDQIRPWGVWRVLRG